MSSGADPRFRELRPEVLRGLSDKDLAPAIYQHALHHCLPARADEVRTLAALPPIVRAVYATTLLEGEVLNGGFNQFFWNSTGRLALVALEGLELLGSPALVAVVQEAIATYESERSILEPFRKDGSVEAFSESYKHTSLGALDRRFEIAAPKGLDVEWATYIRAHIDQCVSPAPAV